MPGWLPASPFPSVLSQPSFVLVLCSCHRKPKENKYNSFLWGTFLWLQPFEPVAPRVHLMLEGMGKEQECWPGWEEQEHTFTTAVGSWQSHTHPTAASDTNIGALAQQFRALTWVRHAVQPSPAHQFSSSCLWKEAMPSPWATSQTAELSCCGATVGFWSFQ